MVCQHCSRQWLQAQRPVITLGTTWQCRGMQGKPRLASQASLGEQQGPVGFGLGNQALAVMHGLCAVGLRRPQQPAGSVCTDGWCMPCVVLSGC